MSKKKENICECEKLKIDEELIVEEAEKNICECEKLEVTEDIKNTTKRRIINVY